MRWPTSPGLLPFASLVLVAVVVFGAGCDFGMTAEEAAAEEAAEQAVVHHRGVEGLTTPVGASSSPGSAPTTERTVPDPSEGAPFGRIVDEQVPSIFPGVGHPIVQPPDP